MLCEVETDFHLSKWMLLAKSIIYYTSDLRGAIICFFLHKKYWADKFPYVHMGFVNDFNATQHVNLDYNHWLVLLLFSVSTDDVKAITCMLN